MPFELILKREVASRPAVELDVNISSNCKGLSVGGKGVIGDWMVEQMVYLWTCHAELISHAIGVALYHRCTNVVFKLVNECVMR